MPLVLSYLFSAFIIAVLFLLALHNRKTGWRRPQREDAGLPALWEAWRKRAGEPAAANMSAIDHGVQLANLSHALGCATNRPTAIPAPDPPPARPQPVPPASRQPGIAQPRI